MMMDGELERDLKDLGSAEEFFDYFDLDFDPAVVHVNRLHILQRFHDYIEKQAALPDDEEAREKLYGELLAQAYGDFCASDALTEKVFKVFHMHEPPQVSISVDDLLSGGPSAAKV